MVIERTEKGFLVICDCGWRSGVLESEEEAKKIQSGHYGSKEHKKRIAPPPPAEKVVEGEEKVGEKVSEGEKVLEGEKEIKKGEKVLPSIGELSPQDAILYYGEEEVINYYRKKKLKEFLDTAPQVSPKQVEWIIMNYDLDERAKSDPNFLYHLLSQSRIEPQLAYRIVQNLVDMEQKLKLKISGQQFPSFPPRMGISPYMQSPQFPIPWQQSQFPPFLQPSQQPQDPWQYFYSWMMQQQRDERYEKLEKEIKKLKEEKIEIKDVKVEDERYEKIEREFEKFREDREREEREKKEREKEERFNKEITELKEALKDKEKGDIGVKDERYEKLESEFEKLREEREREEREKKEREKEERFNKEIAELKETFKARDKSDIMTITVPLKDSSGNIISGPDGKPVQQMFQGPPSYIQALLAQQGEKFSPEKIQAMMGSEIDKRLQTGGISKEELERLLDERESKRAWHDLQVELKELRKDIEKKERLPIAGTSEGTAIEMKKLDLIGDKLEDIHDTIKHVTSLTLTTPKEKPKERSLEDITKLDEELSIIAKSEEK